MRFTFSTAAWPLVRVEFHAEFADADVTSYVAELERVLDKKERYVVLTDASVSLGISASSRKKLTDFISRRRGDFNAYQVANAVLLRSSVHRGMLTALGWMSPMPGNVRGVASLDEAMAWLGGEWQRVTGARLDIAPDERAGRGAR